MAETTLKKLKELIPRTITADQAKDTGMAMVLICLLLVYFGSRQLFFGLAILLLIVNMIRPNVFKPVAKLWFGLSNALGSVMSRIILSIIFLAVVLPVGFIRRAIGKDSLQLRKWKKNRLSVFKARDHEFTSDDIKYPY